MYIMKTFDDFFINHVALQSKYGKKRVKVDIKYFQKHIKTIKFEGDKQSELVEGVITKMNTILTAKCGVQKNEDDA